LLRQGIEFFEKSNSHCFRLMCSYSGMLVFWCVQVFQSCVNMHTTVATCCIRVVCCDHWKTPKNPKNSPPKRTL